MSDSRKDQFIKEVELAFEIYKLLGSIEWESWRRVIGMVEQLRNEDQRVKDEINKVAYSIGRHLDRPC
mgnify:CR=1 FL=1